MDFDYLNDGLYGYDWELGSNLKRTEYIAARPIPDFYLCSLSVMNFI